MTTCRKAVCAGNDNKVVGVHIACASANELPQGFAVAVTMGVSKADFDSTVAIHRGSAEEPVIMKTPKAKPLARDIGEKTE